MVQNSGLPVALFLAIGIIGGGLLGYAMVEARTPKVSHSSETLLKQPVSVTWSTNLRVPAKVLQKGYFVEYQNGIAEWVPESRVDTKNLNYSVPASASIQLGDRAEVEWRGRWYNAEVLQMEQGRYFIHYTGYGDHWDEWVDPSRIRKTTETLLVENATVGDTVTVDGIGKAYVLEKNQEQVVVRFLDKGLPQYVGAAPNTILKDLDEVQ